MPVYVSGISDYEDEWETLPTFTDYNYSQPVFTSLSELKSFSGDSYSEYATGVSGGKFKIYNLVNGVWTSVYENSSLTFGSLTKSLSGDIYAKRAYDVFTLSNGVMNNIYNGAGISDITTNLNNEFYINSGYDILKKVGGSFVKQTAEIYNSSLICDGSNNLLAIETGSGNVYKQYGSSGEFIQIGNVPYPDQVWVNTTKYLFKNKTGDIFIYVWNTNGTQGIISKINNNSDSIIPIQTFNEAKLGASFTCDDDNNMYFTNAGKLYINFNSSGSFVQVQTPNLIYGPISNIGNDLLYKGSGNSIHRFVRQ